MVVLLTCKNKEDPIKNESARVVTTIYIDFSDTQGQVTLELEAGSGRNLNSFKLSCMSLLPARMKMIQSKNEGVSGHNIFPIISLWQFFQMLCSPWSDLAEF